MSGLLGSLYALPDSLFAGAVPLGDVPVPANVAYEEPEQEDQVTSAVLEELSRATLESGATCLTCGLGVPSFRPSSLHSHWRLHDWSSVSYVLPCSPLASTVERTFLLLLCRTCLVLVSDLPICGPG